MIEKNVDINAIRQNIIKLKNLSPKLFCAVVKANAYGHGIEICQGIEDLVDFFAVANAKEAIQIKRLKIHKRVLILGKCNYVDLPNLIKKGIRLTVDTIDDVAHIITMAMSMHKRAYVHIKINSGMNRLGIKSKSELKNILDTLKQCPYVRIEGIYTHFATADNKNSYKLKRQNAKFLSMLSVIPQSDIKKMIIHASNSSAFLKSSKYAYDMVRVGIAMYGYDQVDKVELSPALELKAKIVKTQNVKCGETIGYDAEFVAPQDMTIAVVAMGYADGFMRAYKKGYVLINGTRCKIVGKICMDMFMCDVTHLCTNVKYDKQENVAVNDEEQNASFLNETIAKRSHNNIDNIVNKSEGKDDCTQDNEKCENGQNKTAFDTFKTYTKNNLENDESVKKCEYDTQNQEKIDFLDEISAIFNKDVPEKLFINNDTIYKLFDNGMSTSSIFNIIPLEEILQNIYAKVQDEVDRIENEENSKISVGKNASDEKEINDNADNVDLQSHKDSGEELNNKIENKEKNENNSNKNANIQNELKYKQVEIENLIGEWATILGQDGDEILTARDWAKLSNTIEYEVLTNFNLTRI